MESTAVVEVESDQNSPSDRDNYNQVEHQEFISQGGPSEAYEIFAFIGVALLAFDLFTDLAVGIFTVWTGRFLQGFLSIFIITFPMFNHCSSRVYRTQVGLIKMDQAYEYEDRHLRCRICLPKGIFDPIIWAYNHYVQTVQYRQDPSDEKKRKKFYLSKQMAQLTLKIEANLEAYLQLVLTFFGFLYYFDEYTVASKILVIASMSFSSFSIARAACTDLLKTQYRFRNKPYPDQTRSWKFCRLISVMCATIARMISQGVFVLYCVQLYSKGMRAFESGFDFWSSQIFIFLYILREPLLYCIYCYYDWEFVMAEINSYENPTPRSIFQTVIYVTFYSPFKYFYRGPSLRSYSFRRSQSQFLLFVPLYLVSFIVSFLPILWVNGLSSDLFITLMSTFVTCVVLGSIFSYITRILTNHLPV